MAVPKFTPVGIPLSPWSTHTREEKDNQEGGNEMMLEIPEEPIEHTTDVFVQSLCLFAKSVQTCPTLCDPVDRTVAHEAPLSMGFSRQEIWSRFPCPPPGDLPDPGIEPESPALAGGFCITSPTWEASSHYNDITHCNTSRPKSIIYTKKQKQKQKHQTALQSHLHGVPSLGSFL